MSAAHPYQARRGRSHEGRTLSLLCALIALSCSGATGDSRAGDPSRTGDDAGPVAGPEPATTDPSQQPESNSGQSASSIPPVANGGQSGEGGQPPPESCGGTQWTDPDDLYTRTSAQCIFRQAGTYRCTCDVQRCGGANGAVTGGTPDDDAGNTNSGCRFDVASTSCAEALQMGCGFSPGQNGFCEAGSWDSGPLRCFDQPDGTYQCRCPNLDAPVSRTDSSCQEALLHSCASDCESEAGQCKLGDDGVYHCDCAIGIGGSADAALRPLCTDALRGWCEPACENDRGACYFQPDGQRIVCSCNGDPELHVIEPEPYVQQPGTPPVPPTPIRFPPPEIECDPQLLRSCGS